MTVANDPDASTEEADPFPLFPRRRVGSVVVLAAALAAILFGVGFLVGHSKPARSAFTAVRAIPLHGVAPHPTALGVVRLAEGDAAGNVPVELEVSGLPRRSPGAFYELWLAKANRPFEPCGFFRVHSLTTTVRFTVPSSGTETDGWIVTMQPKVGGAPGPTVLTS